VSVVINEFEVVPAQPQQEQVGPPPPPAPGPGPEVEEELDRILRRVKSREHRLKAT
jgi:hypothetical protein